MLATRYGVDIDAENLQIRIRCTILDVFLIAVFGETGKVVESACAFGHLGPQSGVELEILASRGEIVVSSEGRVGFELVVAIETRLGTCQDRRGGGARSSIASDRQLRGDPVSIRDINGKDGQEVGEVVTHVIHVLDCVDQFRVFCYAIAC